MVADRSSGKPYSQIGKIREFDTLVSSDELVWHRDKEEREVTVIEGQGWQLQYNGCLPILLEEGKTYHIPKMMYHRLFKGATPLKVEINEI